MGGNDDIFADEDDQMLMDEGQKGNKNGKYEENGCRKHWKIVVAGIGVVVLISLGVVIGAVFNHNILSSGGSKSKRSKDVRLPSDVVPLKYNLFLHPNITNNKFDFYGTVKILVEAKKSTDKIVLHSKNLKIANVDVFAGKSDFDDDQSQTQASNIAKEDFEQDKDLEFLKVNLKESVKVSKNYVVSIKFSGSLSKGLEGFYKSSYKTKNNETRKKELHKMLTSKIRYLATTHFEATHARAAFPCFDEPALKATFQITIVHEPQHTALSNMPSADKIKRGDGLIVEKFQESVKMSTYLVAFVVCDYGFKERTTKNNVKVRVWAPKEQIEQANFAVETAAKVLDYYDKFFDVKFPLPKQDLIAIPDFAAGAMENWGLITYRLTSILYDEKESSSANKQWVAVVIAHELAHQWFGNLVTMKWWNDLWLNEGFAAFVEFIGADITDKSWQMMDQFIVDDTQSSLTLDSHANSHPISVTVTDPAQINEIFDTISYDKGASIIRMMKNFLTSDVFHAGLTDYLKKYQFSNAVSDDLWTCMTKAQKKGKVAKHIDVKSVMDTWTLQMGYPVVTIKRDSEDQETALVTQKHFMVDVDAKITKSPFDYKWDVPLTYFYEKKNETQMKWFNRSDRAVKITWNRASGWIKANRDQLGFYRVNYDEENWDALSKQLKDDHLKLSVSDRANLIDDAFELAKANLLSQIKALDMTEYLTDEKEYVPWITALSSIAYIGELVKGRKGYKLYEEYIVQQVKPMVVELGWKDMGTHLQKYLRGAVLRSAVAHNDTESVQEALKIFRDWMNKKMTIAPNMRSVIYLAGIKYGGQKEWDYMFNQYETTAYPSEQRKLMFSLTETNDAKILDKYLKMTLDNSKIRSQDSCSVIEHIAMNPKGSKKALKFVEDNWKTLYERYGKGSFDMSRLIKAIYGRGKTQEAYDQAHKFLTTHKLGSGKLAGKQALAAVKNHIAWLKKNEKDVTAWLKAKVESTRRK